MHLVVTREAEALQSWFPGSAWEREYQGSALIRCAGARSETEEVSDKTNALIGRTVTIRSEPVKRIDANTFTISDEQLFGTEPILIVNASGDPIVLPEGDTEVQVTGEVAKLVVGEVEKEFDLDLERELEVEYEGKPALIARSVALAPEPGEITKNPSKYYGKTIAVPAEVEEIVGPNAFTLDEDELIGGSDLLVLVANPQQKQLSLKDNQDVVATGVLRSFVVTDIERDYDLTWENPTIELVLLGLCD